MIKGYVDEKNQTVFICPHCGFEKRFDASSFKEKNKNVKIKCKCGNTTEMLIEFRRHFRKPVELFGSCFIRKINKKCDIIVRDLSIKGIKFELLHIYSKYTNDISVGDMIELEFKLDTKQEDLISKRCVVRVISTGKYIGAEFDDDNFSKKLGFYLG